MFRRELQLLHRFTVIAAAAAAASAAITTKLVTKTQLHSVPY